CSECDDCRRTLAVLSVPRESSPVPAEREARAIQALRRELDRDRDRTPRGLRRQLPAPARVQNSRVGFAIAAALLFGFVGLLLLAKQPSGRVVEPREAVVQRDPQLPVTPPRQEPVVETPPRETPPQEPAPKSPTIELPKPAPQRTNEVPRFALPADPPARDLPKPEETRPVDPPARPPAHTVVARVLTEVQITDISGSLMIHRKGAKAKERLTGV